jgi:predicted sulfurtransferase
MMELEPAQHLSADEWNDKLQKAENALLLDVRNVYESRVGHFSVSTVPTLLTNTRKYSDLPKLLATNPHMEEKEEIFMYCTGGVRCERVSQLVQTLYPTKRVYQLEGGIQKYLRKSDSESCLYKGKNFVFDPRRTDPVHFGATIGKCLSCQNAHDDYDNGHAPSDNKEARCNACRMLILVCNDCRPKYVCWGGEESSDRPLLYCGLDRCVHEGTAPEPELIKAEEVECGVKQNG